MKNIIRIIFIMYKLQLMMCSNTRFIILFTPSKIYIIGFMKLYIRVPSSARRAQPSVPVWVQILFNVSVACDVMFPAISRQRGFLSAVRFLEKNAGIESG